MSYIEDFKKAIFSYSDDIKKYLSGEKEDYVYCPENLKNTEYMTRITRTEHGFATLLPIMSAK